MDSKSDCDNSPQHHIAHPTADKAHLQSSQLNLSDAASLSYISEQQREDLFDAYGEILDALDSSNVENYFDTAIAIIKKHIGVFPKLHMHNIKCVSETE